MPRRKDFILMIALIIGATGFVGGYLASELAERGYTVYVTKLSSERYNGFAECVYDADITVPGEIAGVINEVAPDVVFHLAAQSSVRLSWERPVLTADVNIKGTLEVLEACRFMKEAGKSARIMLIGSAEEYGKVRPEDCPVKEETPCVPTNIYALSKLTQNHLGRLYSEAYGLDIVSTRSFNHTGPGQSTAFVVPDFCFQVSEIEKGKREAVISVGNLEAMRDFTDVRDIVRAYSALAEKGAAGETYNVGSGRAVRIADILSAVLDEARVPIKVVKDPLRMRPSDVPLQVADISRLQRQTGWKPEIELRRTVRDTLNIYRDVDVGEG